MLMTLVDAILPRWPAACDANTGRGYNTKAEFIAAQQANPTLREGVCLPPGIFDCTNQNLNYYVCASDGIHYPSVCEFNRAVMTKNVRRIRCPIEMSASAGRRPRLPAVCDANTGRRYNSQAEFAAAQKANPSIKKGECPVPGNENCKNNNLNNYICASNGVNYPTVCKFNEAVMRENVKKVPCPREWSESAGRRRRLPAPVPLTKDIYIPPPPVCDANTGRRYANKALFLAAQRRNPSLREGICTVRGNEKCQNNNLNYYVCGYIWYPEQFVFENAQKDKRVTVKRTTLTNCGNPGKGRGVCAYIFYRNLCAFNEAMMYQYTILKEADCPRSWAA